MISTYDRHDHPIIHSIWKKEKKNRQFRILIPIHLDLNERCGTGLTSRDLWGRWEPSHDRNERNFLWQRKSTNVCTSCPVTPLLIFSFFPATHTQLHIWIFWKGEEGQFKIGVTNPSPFDRFQMMMMMIIIIISDTTHLLLLLHHYHLFYLLLFFVVSVGLNPTIKRWWWICQHTHTPIQRGCVGV